MTYPEQYRTQLLAAIQDIDLESVSAAIEMFRETRAHGRCIFVCGTGSGGAAAANLLCDAVRSATLGRYSRFRIVALSDELPKGRGTADDPADERVFSDQIRTIAERGDVVVAVGPSGNSLAIQRGLEYAKRAGCRTISITSRDIEKLLPLSDVAIMVPSPDSVSAEDAQIIVCRMIANYFATVDTIHSARAS